MRDYTTYTKTAWRVVHGRKGRSKHWQGGPPLHRGAECPVCERPLVLLWDLDCAELRKLEPTRFGTLKRLPLYYCFRCCAEDLAYRLSPSEKQVTVLNNDGDPEGDDFPYPGAPDAFERVPIHLEPIPFEVYRLNLFALKAGIEWLTRAEAAKLARWCGCKPDDLRWFGPGLQQVGGAFWLAQGSQRLSCSNTRCRGHREHLGMRELAVVLDDPWNGLPMFEPHDGTKRRRISGAQVIFHICEVCLTVSALNRAT